MTQGPVWITGASSGIGRALALRLAADGRLVVASARSADKLAELARESAGPEGGLGGGIVAWPLDVTDPAAVAAAVEGIEAAHGPIAQAVLNAGSHRPMAARDFSTAALRELVELNVFGTAHCLEALIPPMTARRAGRIAVVASVAGYCGLPTAGAYGLSKGGLINLCEALRPELARDGVTLQLVNPGFVRTPLTDRNSFPMPFLIEAEEAAKAFAEGLGSDRFEIVFPARMHWAMRVLRFLPYGLFFRVTRRMIPEGEEATEDRAAEK